MCDSHSNSSLEPGENLCLGWRTVRPFSAFVLGSLQLIRQGTLTVGKAICFTQFTDSIVNNIQKYPPTNTQNNVNQIYEHPVA